MQHDFEIAALVRAAQRIFATTAFGLVRAAVPEHHGATAILPFGNRPFEGVVLDWMIFNLHCQPANRWIVAWSLGHRPTLHHSVELEPKVEVQMTCRVLLD